jgi:hypothetical protein
MHPLLTNFNTTEDTEVPRDQEPVSQCDSWASKVSKHKAVNMFQAWNVQSYSLNNDPPIRGRLMDLRSTGSQTGSLHSVSIFKLLHLLLRLSTVAH